MSFKGILLLLGILLAYETSNVKVKNVNDIRFVRLSVYNVVVLCIITAPVTWIINSHHDATYAFVSIAILLGNFLSMGFIFIPKVLEIKQNSRDNICADDNGDFQLEEENHLKLVQENDEMKAMINEKEEEIKELKKQLQHKLKTIPRENESHHDKTTLCESKQSSTLSNHQTVKKRFSSKTINSNDQEEICPITEKTNKSSFEADKLQLIYQNPTSRYPNYQAITNDANIKYLRSNNVSGEPNSILKKRSSIISQLHPCNQAYNKETLAGKLNNVIVVTQSHLLGHQGFDFAKSKQQGSFRISRQKKI